MGNLVLTENKKSKVKANKELFISLKKIRKSDIVSIYETIREYYPSNFTLNEAEFEDVFGASISDTEPLFKMLCFVDQDSEEKADLHESLAIVVLFSSEAFAEKIALIFSLFDFDESGVIEISELVLTIQAVIRGLCKLEGVDPPGIDFLEEYSKTLFQEIDKDHNEEIDFKEFIDWIMNNKATLQFLGVYAQAQCLNSMQAEFKVEMNKIIAIFDHFSLENKVELEKLWKRLQEEISKVDESNTDELFSALQKSSIIEGETYFLHKESFIEVMKAWVSFSVSDITHDNYISISELKNLIWIYEDEEPNEFRVIQEMQEIDEDLTETIDRIEWLKHLCNDDKKSGRQIFCSNLKKLFRKYDADNSGSLSYEELKDLLKDTLNESLDKIPAQKDNPNRGLLVDMVSGGILQNLNRDNDSEMTWKEFKNFMDEAFEKQEKLVEILRK